MRSVAFFSALVAVALMGCAAMSESECRVADWGRVGLADGSRGERESRLAAYSDDCGKIGVIPDASAYRQGWDAGIVRFCTPANGWHEGRQGHTSKVAACQGQLGFEAFSRYFDAGMQVYRTNEEIERNAQESNRLQKRLDTATSDDDKRRARQELRDLDRQQLYLRNRLVQQQMLAP